MARFSAEGLYRRGRDVVYVAGDAPLGRSVNGPGGCRLEGLGLADVRKRGGVRKIVDGVYSREANARLSDVLASHPPETTVVLLHQWTRVLSPSVFTALADYRVLLFAHDYFIMCPNGAYYHFPTEELCTLKPMGGGCMTASCDRESPAHKLIRVARQSVQDRATRRLEDLTIICVSQGQRDLFGPAFERYGKVAVLPNPPMGGSLETPRTITTQEPEVPYFLFVGRLTSEKGLRPALAACKSIGAACRVLGDGPERASLEKDFPEVRFEGWVPREQVASAMAEATAVLVPSMWAETSGLVVFEAISAGTPVIVSSRICAADEVVRSGCGLAVEPTDQAGMQRALCTLLHSKTRKPFKQAAVTSANSASPSALQDRYLNALEALALSRGEAPQ